MSVMKNLMHNPTWSFYGPKFPTKEKLLEERNHVFAKHPHTTFVALHVANWPENLDAGFRVAKKIPNMSWSLARVRQSLAGNPAAPVNSLSIFRIASCSARTANRIPRCTPIISDGWKQRTNISTTGAIRDKGRWEIYGMELPDAVLEKVYHKNAERIFAQFKGMPRWGSERCNDSASVARKFTKLGRLFVSSVLCWSCAAGLLSRTVARRVQISQTAPAQSQTSAILMPGSRPSDHNCQHRSGLAVHLRTPRRICTRVPRAT